MNRAVLYNESLSFVKRGPVFAIVAAVLLVFAYAGWSGDRWRDAQLDHLAEFESTAKQGLMAFREQLAGIEAGSVEASPYDANPMSILFPAVLPPSSLADFAIGHADLHPASAELSTWRNLSSVFGRYQFDNPTTLSSSSFDVAMVVIVLMPLLMIAVSFDVLAADRTRGSLAMVLAAPLSMNELVWTRLVFRNALIWLSAGVALLVLAALNEAGGDRFARLGVWFAVSLAYALFWTGLIAYCVSRFRSATATAGSLVGLWLLFTLALPATIATVSEALYPTPSRLAMLSEIRTAQGETNRNLAEVTKGFLMDHPELSVGDENVPSYYRAAYLSNQAARESTRPIVESFEVARAGRERTVRWSQYLSPSVIAQRLLLQSAGADLERQHRFQAQVQASLADLSTAVGPAVVSQNRLTLSEFDELEPFEFQDVSAQTILTRAAAPVLYLLVAGIAFGFAASRRLADETI